MDTNITGGEQNGRKTVALSEEEMREVQALLRAGPKPKEADIVAARRSALRRQGRLSKAERWERYMDTIRERIEDNPDGFRRANAAMTRSVSKGEVHNDATLANMSVQYGNDAFIGDMLCPAVPVSKESGKVPEYNKRSRLAVGDGKIGPRGEFPEITDKRSMQSYACEAIGLKNSLYATTLANQDAPLNEMIDLHAAVLELLALLIEINQLAVVAAAASYATANTSAIAAANRWDSSGGGDPIANIQSAKAAMWNGRGPSRRIAFTSLDVYNVLSRHPAILDLYKYNGNSPGLATASMIAGFFDLDDLLVSESRKDTANEGQSTASYSRVMPDVFGIVRVQTGASIRNATFANTLRWAMPGSAGGFISAQEYKPMQGHGGTWWDQVSVSQDVKVFANDTGYLYTTPIG